MKLINKKIKIVFPLLFLTVFAFAQNSLIFKGGIGDGWASNGYAQTTTNIFKGGNGDGWAAGGYTQATVNIFQGGNGDGWTSGYNPMGALQTVLAKFNAEKAENETALIQWTASNDSHADYFDVERSTDAISFYFIGKVAAGKDPMDGSNNNFTDNRPLKGMNYYRLKQVDANGNTVYTPVRAVKFDDIDGGSIKCFPNPTAGILNIEINGNMQKEAIVINISNSTGIMVSQLRQPANGLTVFTIDMSRFAKGVYFIQVKTNTGSSVQQIVLQ